MSDIQRYSFVGNWDGGADENEDHNGEYVKYDDHIEEVKEHMAIADGHYVDAENSKHKNRKLQARIDELEIQSAHFIEILSDKDIREVKAEGIREMTRHFMYETYKGEELLAYADKLERGYG